MDTRKIIILFLVLAFIPAVSAFSVTYTNINNSIFPNQIASYSVTVVNTMGFNDSFQISTRDPNWVIDVEPPLSSVPSLSTKSSILYLKPKTSISFGPHAIPIKTKSLRTGKFKEDNLLVNVKPETPFGGEYAPAVSLYVQSDSEIDPRERMPIVLQMNNKNPRDMPELMIKVRSEIFSRDETIHLNPLEEKTNRMLFELDPYEEPGIYNVRVSLILENITIAEVSKDFEIISYSKVEEELEKDVNFFKITKTYSVKNNGNLKEDAVLRLDVPVYKKLFIQYEPEPERVASEGDSEYQWVQPLEPGETMYVVVIENYRLLALFLFIMAFSILVYFFSRTPVVSAKEAYAIKESKDSTVIKVQIEVKNRSSNKMRNVTVLDKIPTMADYVDTDALGTLQPDKVVASSTKGTSLRWEIDELEPYEERLITYRIKGKLKIVGGLNLPACKVKFETKGGRERATFSNTYTVMDHK